MGEKEEFISKYYETEGGNNLEFLKSEECHKYLELITDQLPSKGKFVTFFSDEVGVGTLFKKEESQIEEKKVKAKRGRSPSFMIFSPPVFTDGENEFPLGLDLSGYFNCVHPVVIHQDGENISLERTGHVDLSILPEDDYRANFGFYDPNELAFVIENIGELAVNYESKLLNPELLNGAVKGLVKGFEKNPSSDPYLNNFVSDLPLKLGDIHVNKLNDAIKNDRGSENIERYVKSVNDWPWKFDIYLSDQIEHRLNNETPLKRIENREKYLEVCKNIVKEHSSGVKWAPRAAERAGYILTYFKPEGMTDL